MRPAVREVKEIPQSMFGNGLKTTILFAGIVRELATRAGMPMPRVYQERIACLQAMA